MPHVQTTLDSETFKKVKKDAIDKEKTLNDYVRDAVVQALEKPVADGEAKEETTNKLQDNLLKGD
jgi:hypothetical protein